MDVARIVSLTLALFTTTASSATPSAMPQSCEPSWLPTFGNSHGIRASIGALAVLDDGGTQQLFAAGGSEVVCWNGERWNDLGLVSTAYELAVFDDGSGPALYAAGAFTSAGGVAANRIARWDGATWSPLGSGTNDLVEALCVHDDGTGPALYAGGRFVTAGGVLVNRVARWDGTSWSALGSGLDDDVRELAVFDDGSGPALYAGGEFTSAGGVAANRIARWDGTSWSALGTGMSSGDVQALAAFDDGSGLALYAGGFFSAAGGVTARNIARWDGSAWSSVGGWTSGGSSVWTFAVYDDGSGDALYAGGNFSTAAGVPASYLARWDGVAWSAAGSGTNSPVQALCPYDDGDGAVLFAAGTFTLAGGLRVNRLAGWDGTSWGRLESGLDAGVLALAELDLGDGPALYAGGSFTRADGIDLAHVARWNGDAWAALGGGMSGSVQAFAVFDDGSGPALYAGGKFTQADGAPARFIAKWDGASWTALPGGLVGNGVSGNSGEVKALAVFDDGSGPALYAAGGFITAGGVTAHHVARFDGSTWSAVGSGTELPATQTTIGALAVFDDGTGPALYMGGFFTMASIAENHLAKWDGVSWSGLGADFAADTDVVKALVVFDSGSGPALHVAGHFPTVAGMDARGIARWDGASWASLGAGASPGTFYALATLGAGQGAQLFAGGSFTAIDGVPASHIARWDGAHWNALGAGRVDTVEALAIHDDGDGTPALVAGGEFDEPIDSADTFVALWDVAPDETPPVLHCPTSVSAHIAATGATGKAVYFAVECDDACDPAPSVVCVPPSGSVFPIGTTIVTCTATDATGNESVCDFPVTVQSEGRRKLR